MSHLNDPGLRELRANLRSQRRSLPFDVRSGANHRICTAMSRLKSFQQAENVAGYLAFDGEADPLELMKLAHAQGKQVFVPVIVAKQSPLQFCPWNPDVPLKVNRFGIQEPDVEPRLRIPPERLEFVICPVVAFDQHCNRIGSGAGYYDRSFAFLQSSQLVTLSKRHATTLVGFAFEIQKVARIDPQPWDVPLHWVVTERQIYRRYQDLA